MTFTFGRFEAQMVIEMRKQSVPERYVDASACDALKRDMIGKTIDEAQAIVEDFEGVEHDPAPDGLLALGQWGNGPIVDCWEAA